MFCLTRDKLEMLNNVLRSDHLVLKRIDFNEFVCYPEFFARFGQYSREVHFDNCNLTQQQLFDCLTTASNLLSLTIKVKNDLFVDELRLIDEKATAIAANLSKVKSFTLALDTVEYDRRQIQYIMGMMTNLEVLIFPPTYLNPSLVRVSKIFFDYIDTCPDDIKLRYLSLEDLIDKDFLQNFSKITKLFSVIDLTLGLVNLHDDDDDDRAFESLCEKLSGVRILSISTGEKQLNHVCRHLTQLTELHFTTTISNQNIENIGKLQNLQKLTLKCVRELAEDQLLGIFSELHDLKELRFDYEISPRLLNNIICEKCTELTVLELPRMCTNNFEVLFKNLPNLKRLLLYFCQNQYDFTIGCDITNLQQLEYLEINNFAPGMTLELIEKLPNLKPESYNFTQNCQCDNCLV